MSSVTLSFETRARAAPQDEGSFDRVRKPSDMRNIALGGWRFYKKQKTFWEAKVRVSRLPGRLEATSTALLCIALLATTPAAAEKRGGTLRLYHNDDARSTSLLEEATIASVTPFAAVSDNLVVFDGSEP